MSANNDLLVRPVSEYPVVLFDFDGTVANTIPAILRVAGEVFARHGIEVTREQLLVMIGPPLEEGLMAVGGVSYEVAHEYAEEYRRLFDEILTPEDYPVLPGICETLNGLKAQGKRIAIATSRMEYTAKRMIEALGLDQFEAIAGRVDGVRYTKAESIQGAMDMLGVQASECIMVGDRLHDVEGAAEHRMPCIGIYTGAAEAGELESAGAAVVLRGTEELQSLFGL